MVDVRMKTYSGKHTVADLIEFLKRFPPDTALDYVRTHTSETDLDSEIVTTLTCNFQMSWIGSLESFDIT